jgi:hypothetical protein
MTRNTPVLQGIFASLRPQPEAPTVDVIALLAAFEMWYEAAHRAPFWNRFDQPMPETRGVDF